MVAYAWFIPLFIVRLFYLPIASFHINLPCHVCLLLQRQDFPLPSLSRVQAIAVAYISFHFFFYIVSIIPEKWLHPEVPNMSKSIFAIDDPLRAPPLLCFLNRGSRRASTKYCVCSDADQLYRLLYGLPLYSGALRRLLFLSQDYDLANFAMRGLPISIIK